MSIDLVFLCISIFTLFFVLIAELRENLHLSVTLLVLYITLTILVYCV